MKKKQIAVLLVALLCVSTAVEGTAVMGVKFSSGKEDIVVPAGLNAFAGSISGVKNIHFGKGCRSFKGISAKAVIKVPAAKLSAYQKLLKGKGQKNSVKITK